MLPDVSAGEVRDLARAMTLKYGFLGLPQGGSKAGIIGDPEASQEQRFALLADFGRVISPLLASRAYIPGPDMGTDCAAIRHMLGAAGIKVASRDLNDNSSGYYTAVSTMAGVLACASRAGLDIARSTAAVEGFGKVGGAMATLLAQAGATVVAVSTSRGALYNPHGLDVPRLTSLESEVGSRVVDVYRDAESIGIEKVFELPVDVVSPCARHWSIREDNVSRISAKIICAGANNPITPGAEPLLTARGALWLPDFLTNCGGVLGGTMEFASMKRDEIKAFITDRIQAAAGAVLTEARHTGSSPRKVAERIARGRFAAAKNAAEHPTLQGRAMGVGLALYRRGLIPPALVRDMAFTYFERLLEQWRDSPAGIKVGNAE
jgi:glutamate dehydrogenase (NAD(P)+)